MRLIFEAMASELVSDFKLIESLVLIGPEHMSKVLTYLGMKIEERQQPWAGASGVFHPVLTESVVRFQAQAMGELFPAQWASQSKIMGKMTPEKFDQAERVETELNYL